MRLALFVYVNLDPVPGAFHTKESALLHVGGVLTNYIRHYNPGVELAPDDLQPEYTRRLALMVYVDLDPVDEFPKNFAMRLVRKALREAIGHYSPVVAYAPRALQPHYTEGTITS